jgi:glucose/mannose-6-phosphate isomerase
LVHELPLKVDQRLLYLIYEKWPEHFREAANIKCSLDKDFQFYRSVFFCGMGGSATSCDILSDLMHCYGSIPSSVVRGHALPPTVNNTSLVIINSVSGNTLEALCMAAEASAKKAEVICISAGGKLKEMALSRGHRHINIPNLFLPRASLPYLVFPGLRLISPFLSNGFDKTQFEEICRRLSEQRRKISMNISGEENLAKKVASFLKNGFAFCFASPLLLSAATRFKNSLNENAKLHCSKDSILESTHNEIVPFTYMGNGIDRKVIFLRWKSGDSMFITQRFEKVQHLFSEIGQSWIEVAPEDGSLLSAILTSIYILDYSTVYIAISKGLDPSTTPAIDILKKT